MKKITLKTFICIFALIFTLSISISAFATNNINASDSATEPNFEGKIANFYVQQAISLIMSKYKFDITKEELYKAALEKIITDNPELLEDTFKALFSSLDSHTVYYTQEEFEKYINNMTNEVFGIGVLVSSTKDGMFVNKIYNNSPAKESGFKVGDIITAVDGKNVVGVDFDVARSYVAGPENSSVSLTILRNGQQLTITTLRRKVVIDPGFFQTVENDTIGYIALYDFYEHAGEFVAGALKHFDTKNIENIILDLRNNPGGSVSTMVEIASLLIPEGPAIHFEFKDSNRNNTLYSTNKNPKYNVAVLVNGNSASASEAISVAIQDTGVGIVVGTDTFGKGTMQNITTFKIGGGIKMTEAEYLSPNKRKINGIGVGPDVYVEDKTINYSKSNYKKITYDRVMKNGDVGSDVYALEERLYFLGYEIGIPDEIYDKKTEEAVLTFQSATKLYPYGVADITTQLKLEEVLSGNDVVQNDIYQRAVDIFKNENWEDYKYEPVQKQ